MKQRLIHLDKFPGRPNVKKTSLMYVEDGKICDGCDTYNVRCASINLLCQDVAILCQDCVEGILDSFDASALRDRKINNLLTQ